MIQLFTKVRYRQSDVVDFMNWCAKPHSARWIKIDNAYNRRADRFVCDCYKCGWCGHHIQATDFSRYVADIHIADDGYTNFGLSRLVIERLLEF